MGLPSVSVSLLRRIALVLAVTLLVTLPARATLPVDGDEGPRSHQTLTEGWRTFFQETGTPPPAGVARADFDDTTWSAVEVPHNHDDYHGYRQTKHGQLHGTAWYRRTFTVDAATLAAVARDERRVFLLFEGVGSYATVWVNGREIGRHAGGLTTFTLDVTAALATDASTPNFLLVRADHPSGIRNLPWVCGGCERAYGFSEGSQPFGINRPVHVIVTDTLRIAPFGVHAWNGRDVSTASARAEVRTEVTNHATTPRSFVVRHTLLSPEGAAVTTAVSPVQTLAPGATATVATAPLTAAPARLWSLTDPALYTIRTELIPARASELSTLNSQPSTAPSAARATDRVDTAYGFRWIDWPHGDDVARGTFLLNGEPVFLNGTCEYQHLLGNNHAFSAAQITARVRQMQAAGFNAFRDAHHPHNLRYNQHWDRDGVAWWTQFGAQIWFDRDDFRTNYLALLRDWVKERRNSPSLVLWGLQNESKLPTEFAAAATALIRELDPTCGDQRLVTTCNGGTGTDWDVPQNWTGTYGGDPATYAEDLRKQVLIGEYGAWRSVDLRAPAGSPSTVGYDEDYFTALLETKVRLAHTARDYSAGHFQWIFSTHDNPGRSFGSKGEQLADGWALLDRVGPANNKGLLTTWGEPIDAFYMYRSNFAPAATEPMVVIAGANHPERVTTPGATATVVAYSNADEVELFNGPVSLGVRTRAGVGTHFTWENVALHHRELRAEARRARQVVATDAIELPHLPPSTTPQAAPTRHSSAGATAVRVNCGGPAYTDHAGNLWLADRDFREGDSWGALSWAQRYPHLPAALGSARQVHTPVADTPDPALYQTFRYGRDDLRYRFALPEGAYRVELHFAEPWYGRGGTLDATGWRLFDVAFNGQTILRDLDLFREAGFGRALVKTVEARIADGGLEISFPRVASYQAVISAIAIFPLEKTSAPLPLASREIVADLAGATLEGWLQPVHVALARVPEILRHQAWLRPAAGTTDAGNIAFTLTATADVFIARDTPPAAGWESSGETVVTRDGRSIPLQRRHATAGERFSLSAADARVLVAIVPARPLAPAQAIRDLVVENSADAAAWRAAGSLARGVRPHGATCAAISRLSGELSDLDWLLTPPAEPSADLRARFTAADHLELTVALDAAAPTPPAWLRDWFLVTNHSVTLGERPQRLYRRRAELGSVVEVGANARLADGTPAPMYLVFARAVRPSATYAAPAQPLAPAAAEHTWTIEVGVGDRYTFVIPHRPAPGEAPRVRYEFLDKAGAVLCTDERTLGDLTVESDGWSRWRVRTCTSVNAGTYAVRLTHVSGPALTVGPLTVE